MALTMDKDWATAKKKFETITGIKKPKPSGFFASAFNHTNLSGQIKKMQANYDKMNKTTDPKNKAKGVAAAKKLLTSYSKDVKAYIKILDRDAKDETSENKGEATKISKGLKMLKSSLIAIETSFSGYIETTEITLEGGDRAKQYAKMLVPNLKSTIANAKKAYKTVKADTTAKTYNEVFHMSDSPARKVQVQLVQAAGMNKKGQLPDLIVDPRKIADRLNPWQSHTAANSSVKDDATPNDVNKLNEEFKEIVKLADRYLTDLIENS